MKTALLGGASRFAHLAGIVALGGGRRADNDKDKDARRARADDDEDKARADDGDGDDDNKDKSSRRSKARADDDEDKARADDGDDDDDKDKARADDGDDDEEDAPKSKKSRRARADDDEDDERCEDDDDKDEMHGRSAAANARRRERARCSAIFGHDAAAANVALAASLAFETTMTRKEAIKVLKSQPTRPEASHTRSEDRADRNARLSPGGAPQSGAKSVEASWATAIEKVTAGPRRK